MGESLEEKGTYLLNRYSIPVMAVIFLIATIGVSTAIIESVRMNNWRNDMNWVPGPDTYIYPLNAGKYSERISVRGQCYRKRAYPSGNEISTYVTSKKGEIIDVPAKCNTNNCPTRIFKLAKSGHLFMEFASGSNQQGCQKMLAGWLPHELPRGSVFQNQAIERMRKEREQNEKIAADKKRFENSYERHDAFLTTRDPVIISKKWDCYYDNIVKRMNGNLYPIQKIVKSNSVIYKVALVPSSLKAIYFNASNGNCQTAFAKLRSAGLMKGWNIVNPPRRWGSVPNSNPNQALQPNRPGLKPWKHYKLKNFLTAARFTINSNECFEFEATKIPIGGSLEIKIPAGNGRQQKMNRGVVTGPAKFDIKYENFIGKATFRFRGWNMVNGRCQ